MLNTKNNFDNDYTFLATPSDILSVQEGRGNKKNHIGETYASFKHKFQDNDSWISSFEDIKVIESKDLSILSDNLVGKVVVFDKDDLVALNKMFIESNLPEIDMSRVIVIQEWAAKYEDNKYNSLYDFVISAGILSSNGASVDEEFGGFSSKLICEAFLFLRGVEEQILIFGNEDKNAA